MIVISYIHNAKTLFAFEFPNDPSIDFFEVVKLAAREFYSRFPIHSRFENVTRKFEMIDHPTY